MQENVRQDLVESRGYFLFGNTAPDVQVVSRQKREETHFFTLPIQDSSPLPWKALLLEYPGLLNGQEPSAGRSAFLAGYLCHLQADWYWVKEIFFPVFGPTSSWSTFGHRLYLHNVLRAYLDEQVTPALPTDAAEVLARTSVHPWLPFLAREHLHTWRDFLSEQLRPGSAAQTVEVFADRQGLSPVVFYELLRSEDEMEQHIFKRLPREELVHYRHKLVQENIRLLHELFAG